MVDKPQAIAAVSGGVDSTVAAILAKEDYEVIPVIINTGFMRAGEVEWVRNALQKAGFELPWLWNAEDYFLDEIGKETDAEKKRAAFKRAYFGCLVEACRMMHIEHLIQGTIAPDWIESQGGIKTHHNVTTELGIDPIKEYGIEIVEPIRNLYKDQVREYATKLGVPDEIVHRQPFPGPGLLLRIVGERVTYGKLETLRKCTAIVHGRLAPLFNDADGQYFCAIVADGAKVTGCKGDMRSYGAWVPNVDPTVANAPGISRVFKPLKLRTGYNVVIRAITSQDFMTADVINIPEDVLMQLASELQEVPEVGSVYYDITTKPPGTIEFE